MRRLNRNSIAQLRNQGNDAVFGALETNKCGLNPMTWIGVLVACLMLLSVVVSVSVTVQDIHFESIWSGAEARVLQVKPRLQGSEDDAVKVRGGDKLLSGLLSNEFEEKSCVSRYQSLLYRSNNALTHKPSAYLISRLRSYEALHKRCGPHTEPYNRTIEQLIASAGKQTGPGSSDCNYVVWISFSGLGNRILTLASAFLYSLLTNRVLLVHPGVEEDITHLFCEPFPHVSWLLPSDFPLRPHFSHFDKKSVHSYGNMVVKKNKSNDLSFIYLHLVHDYGDHDKLFFCDQDQSFLARVPWLVMKTDNYFVPSLFLIPSFEEELRNLFPEKQTVFHFLGRYLFHPTNQVWGLVTRYYQAYLAKADEKIGIQIRVFNTSLGGPFLQHVLDQVLACTLNENLLPEINRQEEEEEEDQRIVIDDDTAAGGKQKKKKSTAVLMTSLSSGYFEKIRDMYWEFPTTTGEIVGIYQPSQEGYQQTEKQTHNMKAWAEMYLLSMTDKLVTSSWSTFGYVAQGLGGLKPWILYKPENSTAPDPPCRRAMSIEPCFHAPPFWDCKNKVGIDTGALVPYVRHCEDMSWGLKLVDP